MTLTELYGWNLDYYNGMLRAEQKDYEFYRDETGEVRWRRIKREIAPVQTDGEVGEKQAAPGKDPTPQTV